MPGEQIKHVGGINPAKASRGLQGLGQPQCHRLSCPRWQVNGVSTQGQPRGSVRVLGSLRVWAVQGPVGYKAWPWAPL